MVVSNIKTSYCLNNYFYHNMKEIHIDELHEIKVIPDEVKVDRSTSMLVSTRSLTQGGCDDRKVTSHPGWVSHRTDSLWHLHIFFCTKFSPIVEHAEGWEALSKVTYAHVSQNSASWFYTLRETTVQIWCIKISFFSRIKTPSRNDCQKQTYVIECKKLYKQENSFKREKIFLYES